MSKGFTLLEFLIVVAIIIILSTFAIPAWDKFMEINRYHNDVMAVEHTINRAKITAMSKTTNVGVCVVDNEPRILIYDVGFGRGNNPCSGTFLFGIILRGLNTQITSNGNIIFDPRGLSIVENYNSTICIYNTVLNSYYKIIISRGSQRVEKGSGSC